MAVQVTDLRTASGGHYRARATITQFIDDSYYLASAVML